jgi:hypothetical protein
MRTKMYYQTVLLLTIGATMFGCAQPHVTLRRTNLQELRQTAPSVAAAYRERIERLGETENPVFEAAVSEAGGEPIKIYGIRERGSGVDRPDLMVLRFPIVQQGDRTLLRFEVPDPKNPSDVRRQPPEVLLDLRQGRHVVLWCEGILRAPSASPCVKRIDGSIRTILSVTVPQGEEGLWFSWNLHYDQSAAPGYHLDASGFHTGLSWPIWFNDRGEPGRVEVPANVGLVGSTP